MLNSEQNSKDWKTVLLQPLSRANIINLVLLPLLSFFPPSCMNTTNLTDLVTLVNGSHLIVIPDVCKTAAKLHCSLHCLIVLVKVPEC